MKVVKSASHYTEAARDEIQLLSCAKDNDPSDSKHCCRLFDHFEHVGPHGRHICMIFEVLGDNLLTLIRTYRHRGIPLDIVRHLTKQLLVALNFLHVRCRIIHTDLKPENVMLKEPLRRRQHDGVVHGKKEDVDGDGQRLEGKIAAALASGVPLTKNQKKKLKKKMQKESSQQQQQHHSMTGTAANSAGNTKKSKSHSNDDDALTEEDADVIAGDYSNANSTVVAALADLQQQQQTCEPSVSLGGDGGGNGGNGSIVEIEKEIDNNVGDSAPSRSNNTKISNTTRIEPSTGDMNSTAAAAVLLRTTTLEGEHLNAGIKGSDVATHGNDEERMTVMMQRATTSTATTAKDNDSDEEYEDTREESLSPLEDSDNNDGVKTIEEKKAQQNLEERLITMPCKIVDFGNACWVNKHFTDDIQTRQYRSPEVRRRNRRRVQICIYLYHM